MPSGCWSRHEAQKGGRTPTKRRTAQLGCAWGAPASHRRGKTLIEAAERITADPFPGFAWCYRAAVLARYRCRFGGLTRCWLGAGSVLARRKSRSRSKALSFHRQVGAGSERNSTWLDPDAGSAALIASRIPPGLGSFGHKFVQKSRSIIGVLEPKISLSPRSCGGSGVHHCILC